MRAHLITTYRAARRLVLTVVGLTVIVLGIALLVLPGPGILTIFAGLAVLAIEFRWAKHLLRALKEQGSNALSRASRKKNAGKESDDSDVEGDGLPGLPDRAAAPLGDQDDQKVDDARSDADDAEPDRGGEEPNGDGHEWSSAARSEPNAS